MYFIEKSTLCHFWVHFVSRENQAHTQPHTSATRSPYHFPSFPTHFPYKSMGLSLKLNSIAYAAFWFKSQLIKNVLSLLLYLWHRVKWYFVASSRTLVASISEPDLSQVNPDRLGTVQCSRSTTFGDEMHPVNDPKVWRTGLVKNLKIIMGILLTPIWHHNLILAAPLARAGPEGEGGTS